MSPSDKEQIMVLPGDDLTNVIISQPPLSTAPQGIDEELKEELPSTTHKKRSTLKLGSGLSYDNTTQTVRATLAGRLFHRKSTNTFMILQKSKRYIPRVHDRIVAIVEERVGDHYRMSIPGSSCGQGLLHSCAFEGATKRNKPQLGAGSLVYCRISSADIDRDLELTCIVGGQNDGGAARKDWMTDECTYGELKGGSCFQVNLALARDLLNPSCLVLDALATTGRIPFEICIGVNGLIWVHSSRPEYTILVMNAIRNSEVMTGEQIHAMVKQLVHTIKQSLQDE
jgi:exosome complex component RRP40